MMEAVRTSETSVYFKEATRRLYPRRPRDLQKVGVWIPEARGGEQSACAQCCQFAGTHCWTWCVVWYGRCRNTANLVALSFSAHQSLTRCYVCESFHTVRISGLSTRGITNDRSWAQIIELQSWGQNYFMLWRTKSEGLVRLNKGHTNLSSISEYFIDKSVSYATKLSLT
jgi:hypothetical protein